MSNIDPLEIQMFLRTVLRMRRKYKHCRLHTVRHLVSCVLRSRINYLVRTDEAYT